MLNFANAKMCLRVFLAEQPDVATRTKKTRFRKPDCKKTGKKTNMERTGRNGRHLGDVQGNPRARLEQPMDRRGLP